MRQFAWLAMMPPRGVSVQYRCHESMAVSSPAVLVAGLNRLKGTFRQRNLYCQFALSELPASELEAPGGKSSATWGVHPGGTSCEGRQRGMQRVAPRQLAQIAPWR
ncbi:hypothetical protein CBM2608_U60011 [Cupriavidus taiwanensis]|nr:hypothetical protein CBM2608_U60011 [Cupriavidus taiwanensis]SPA43889.1 hypothetical protein CBM2629_A100087 [Cupriavidus taiwanensis]